MPRLEFTTAIGYSVLGMLIVFVVLIALMYVVKIMAAMVMAVVAHKLGKPLNELRFISIREVTEE